MSSASLKVAQRLREARVQAGLSQGQVARELGWHRPTVTEIEAGRRRVAADELTRFAGLYHVRASWLLGDDSAPELDPELVLAARQFERLRPKDREKVQALLRSILGSEDGAE